MAEVEAASGGQFVVAVIGKADAYPEIPWKAFSLGAVAAALFVAAVQMGIAHQPYLRGMLPGLIIVLGAGMVFALLSVFLPPVARALLDRARARAEVEQYARAMFLERGMFQTRERVGVLVLLSLFEREAAIVADAGVRRHVADGEIDALVAQVAPLAKEGLVVQGARRALTEIASRLQGRLAAAAAANELPDAPVEERGT